jgi:hypothetical protein
MDSTHSSKSNEDKAGKQTSSPSMDGAFDALEQIPIDPAHITPKALLQLQRTVGNRAVNDLIARKAITPASNTLVQRWPPWGKKKGEEYQNLVESDSDSSEVEAEEPAAEQEASPAYSKLKALGDKMAEYHAIHTNYQKYKQYLGSKAWNLFNEAWKLVNKVTGVLSNLDPSGIAKAVTAVSKAVQTLVGYITEAVRLCDETLVEELTPLLPKALTMGTVKDAVKEAFDFGKGVKSAWDAVEAAL